MKKTIPPKENTSGENALENPSVVFRRQSYTYHTIYGHIYRSVFFFFHYFVLLSEDKTHTQTQFPLEYLTSSFVIPPYNSNVLSSSTSSYLYYILYTMFTYLCPIRTQQKITWMWVLARPFVVAKENEIKKKKTE